MKDRPFPPITRRQFLRSAAATVGGIALASCAPGSPTPQPTAQVAATPVAAPPTASPATASPLSINVMWRDPGNPVNKNGRLYKELVQKTGVAYDGFGLPPGPEYTQKVNAVMASGQPPELMWVNDRTTYIQLAKQGAFWELDEFLADKAAYSQLSSYPDYAYDALRVNGKMMAIPSYRVYRGFPVHIRTDWLDKFGLSMPTKIDDVWKAAEAFATKDPDGGGTRDTFGLMWWSDLQGLDQLLSGFGVVSSWEEDKPDHLIPTFITQKYKNMLQWLQQGTEAGFFDPDSVIMKRDEAETTKGNAGKCGIFYTGAGGRTLSAIQKNNPKAQLMPLPPMLTPDGKYTYAIPYLYIGFWVVTKTVKSKEDVKRILKFVDYGSAPEGADLLDYGVLGDYDVRPDGTKSLNDAGKADGAGALWLIPPPDKYLYEKVERATGHPELADAQRKLVDSVDKIAFPDPILYTYPGPVELEKGAELSRTRSETFSKILARQLPITAFDDWVAQYRKAGGDQIIEERSASYAQRKKS